MKMSPNYLRLDESFSTKLTRCSLDVIYHKLTVFLAKSALFWEIGFEVNLLLRDVVPIS